MYLYIERQKKNGRIYRYLVLEEVTRVNGKRVKKRHLYLPLEKAIKILLLLKEWCGGWDLNPRRPTPSGPKPDPFDQARAPPHLFVFMNFV